MAEISIVSRYRHDNVTENITDYFDQVERAGYISPDKKIEAFLSTGSVPSTSGGSDYELDQEEVDLDPSSDEYVEVLHKEAEEFTAPIMPQFVDKLSAVEILDQADKVLDAQKKAPKPEKKSDNSEKVLSTLKNIESELKAKKEEQ